MKETVRLIIILIMVITINTKASSQNYYLDIPENIVNLGCGDWCWVHASLNTIHYYGESSPDIMEIVEYARLSHSIKVNSNVTSCYITPDSCCKEGLVGPMLQHWGLQFGGASGILDRSILANEFKYNQPVIIIVVNLDDPGGHFFIAHGIRFETVYILDASFGYCARGITDIWPGKRWSSSLLMKHSPNWSRHNYISGGSFEKSQCFSATDTISVNAVFKKNPSNPDQHFTFSTDGVVYLDKGFKIYPGCSLDIFTNNSNCP